MIKHTIEKIDKLIREKAYGIPEIMFKLVAFLLCFEKKIEQKNSEYGALDLYADALKLFRKYLVDEPYKLTKITIPAIQEALLS